MKRLTTIILCAGILCACTLSGCAFLGKQDVPYTKNMFLFDTIITITIYDYKGQQDANTIVEQAFVLCDYYDRLFNKDKAGSDINAMNAAKGKPVTISNDTIDLLNAAITYAEQTDGLFDVTIQPVKALWNFADENPALPDNDAINEAVSHVNYKNLVLAGNTVTLKDADAAIDVGGIAKGMIADKVCDYLAEQGVTDGFVNLGGDIAIVGNHKGKGLFVGIQAPFEETGKTMGGISVSGNAIATSGIYERFFKKDGILYHHILNPHTGYPVSSDVVSATVISQKSLDCDAVATGVILLGAEKGLQYVNGLDGTEAIIVLANGELLLSEGFQDGTYTFEAGK